MGRKFCNEKIVHKVASTWCILGQLENIVALLSNKFPWNFSHVKREAKKVVNLMANMGVDGGQCICEGQLMTFRGVEWIYQ